MIFYFYQRFCIIYNILRSKEYRCGDGLFLYLCFRYDFACEYCAFILIESIYPIKIESSYLSFWEAFTIYFFLNHIHFEISGFKSVFVIILFHFRKNSLECQISVTFAS
jgi:hypothetical protein